MSLQCPAVKAGNPDPKLTSRVKENYILFKKEKLYDQTMRMVVTI